MSTTYDYFKQAIGSTISEDDYKRYMIDFAKLINEFPNTCKPAESVISKDYDKIFIVGIGDSLYSAGSTKYLCEKLVNEEIRVVESMEFNYYVKDQITKDSLVIICSGGGQAARTVESYYIAYQRGAEVLALTLSPHSRLKSACHNTLCYEPDRPAYVGGSCNYIVIAAMVYLLFIQRALYRGVKTDEYVTEAMNKFTDYAKIGMRSCMGPNEEKIKKCMKDAQLQGVDKFYLLGAGPSYDLTLYGAAKFMEEAAVDGIIQHVEEYGHEQYWVHNRRGAKDFIFLIAPQGPSVNRTSEYLDEMNFLQLTSIVLTTGVPRTDLEEKSSYLLSTVESVPEDFYWLTAGHVLARFANFFTEYSGLADVKFMKDDQKTEHYKTIQFSRFCEELSEFDVEIPDDRALAESGPTGRSYSKK